MILARRLLAEFIGTFALVFVGCAAVCVPAPAKNLLSIALAFGLTVAVMVSAAGHISGAHFNPAVSFALFLTKKMIPMDAVFYILTQLIAAGCASSILKAWFGGAALAGATPVPSDPFTPGMAFAMEVIMTFFLVFVIFGVAVDKRGPGQLAGILIGLTVTLDILIGGPYTGASMNPARSFGPALASGTWTDFWVYLAGPLVGAALGAFAYQLVRGD